MITTFSQTPQTHDLILTDGGLLATETDMTAYEVVVADALRTLVGELQLDLERGIPWMTTILAKRNRVAVWKHYVENRITEFDFVRRIESFNVEYDYTRNKVSFALVIVATDGRKAKIEDEVIG